MYLVSSRTGIYLDFTRKIIDGAFFGVTHKDSIWYAFSTEEKDKNVHNPTFKGYILQFEIENGEAVRQKRIIEGLDNGVHQICIWKDHLYILETYIQRITVLNLKNHSDTRHIFPFKKAICPWYFEKGYKGDWHGYLHMNAITVQDDRFYIMCPHLKNTIEGGEITNSKTISQIAVFGPDWKQIDVLDTGHYFCHDLVFVGHEIFFGDATNTIYKINIVTKEVKPAWTVDPVSPELRRICRGLSMSHDKQVFTGTHDFKNETYIVNVLTGEKIVKDVIPSFITRLDGMDYNYELSPLRKSFTLSLPSREFNPHTRTIFNEISKLHPEVKRPGSDYPDMVSLLNPEINGEDLQNNIQPSIVLTGLSKKISLPPYLVESGPFYLYPRGHVLNWHSNEKNMKDDQYLLNYRMYTVSTTGNSYFLYKHPISNKIHAIKDIDGTSLVFNLKPGGKKFWHAVVTMTGSRLSYGVKFCKDALSILGIENIWDSEPTDFKFIFRKPENSILGPKSIRGFLTEWETDQLRTQLQDCFMTDGELGTNNKHIPSIRRSKVYFLPKDYNFINLYIKIFNSVLKFNNENFKFDLYEFGGKIQYTEYDESYQGHYDWHLDIGENNFTRKLTVVIQLSDSSEYEGGELQVHNGQTPYRTCSKEKGSMIMFPSFLLHRVTPVTKGIRRCLVMWFTGPSFV